MTSQRFLTITGLTLLAVLAIGAAFVLTSGNRMFSVEAPTAPQTPVPAGLPARQAGLPNRQTSEPAPALRTFTDSFVTGFEGEFYRITLSLPYDPTALEINTDGPRTSRIIAREKATGRAHVLEFFYNGSAGFATPTDLWKSQYASSCVKCVGTAPSLGVLHAEQKDVTVFGNNTMEDIVFSRAPGFIHLRVSKPVETIRYTFESFTFQSERTENPEQGCANPAPAASPNPPVGCHYDATRCVNGAWQAGKLICQRYQDM